MSDERMKRKKLKKILERHAKYMISDILDDYPYNPWTFDFLNSMLYGHTDNFITGVEEEIGDDA